MPASAPSVNWCDSAKRLTKRKACFSLGCAHVQLLHSVHSAGRARGGLRTTQRLGSMLGTIALSDRDGPIEDDNRRRTDADQCIVERHDRSFPSGRRSGRWLHREPRKRPFRASQGAKQCAIAQTGVMGALELASLALEREEDERAVALKRKGSGE
jgi:hypothetical protein